VATKDIQNEELQARAYLAIVSRKTNGDIADEPRLATLDRLRILIGAMGLRRFEGGRSTMNQQALNERSWSPRLNIAKSDSYGDLSLWDIFNRSPMGIVLNNDAEVEHLALRPPTA